MPAPADPHRLPDPTQTQPPSVRSDADDTAGANPAASFPLAPTFGPPAEPGEVGTLGPYRVVRQLGRGGMGAVYAALDTRLNRRLALKVMLPEYAADPASKERFLREARAAAQVAHDNVVTVYEADERDGVPYIAMQFLQGYPLDEYLKKKGNPTLPQVLRIARETAAGLAAAHHLGLVHRDIKPGNLWLEAPHGRVKVLDFGLAKPVDADVELTKSGAIVGTPAYMSPQQARSEKVDHRTDLFSLGAVLYRLCTGRLPFQAPTTMATLMALATDEPPPVRELNPAVPEPLADLIHQLLAKNPADRPASADEVVKRVRMIAEGLAPSSGPSAAPVSQPQVVYVPIQVTALPEANPFADLDVPQPTPAPSEREATPVPVRKQPRGSWLWPAVGFAALLAVVVGAVIVIIKNKDGTPTKTDTPDTGITKGTDGKTVTSGGSGDRLITDASADRKAAEWVLSLGGSVRLNGEARDIRVAGDLPKFRFALTGVILSGKAVTDAELVRLRDCKELTYIEITGTGVTDAGLAHLKDLRAITWLDLNNTKVTDAGLAHFKGCKGLADLNLNGTQVTDAGLVHLKDHKGLSQLLLANTPVADAGLTHLKDLKGIALLDLSNTKVTDAGMANFKDCKGLKILYLNGTQVTDAGLAHFKGCKGLTALRLGSTKLTEAGLAHFKDCVELSQLGIEWTAITDVGLAHLRDLTELAHLQLGGTPITDSGLAHLKDCKKLVSIDLNSTRVTDEGLAHLKDLKGLSLLHLRETKVSAKGLAEFHAAVPGCKIDHSGGTIAAIDVNRKAAEWVLSLGGTVGLNNGREIRTATELPKDRFTLTVVKLDGKAVPGAGLANLKELKGLTSLQLAATGVTDAGLAHLAGLTGLEQLNLNHTKVTDAGLAHLKDLKALTHLHLHTAPVTDAGLAHLKSLNGLTVLDLGHTRVTDTGLTHLKELKGLTHITMLKTKVTAAGLAEFHAAVPRCKIEHDSGTIEPKK